jgi:hypothetical protein
MPLLDRNVGAGRKAGRALGTIALVFFSMLSCRAVSTTPLSVGEFDRMALRCGPQVAPSTLMSIAKVESSLQPACDQ